ncbi:MAG: DUF4143 domain-containing protein [Sphingomonas sp.]
MSEVIKRTALAQLEEQLAANACCLLLGPRQVGKTSLALRYGESCVGRFVYLDLEQEKDRSAIADFDAFAQQSMGRLAILDEAQCAPEIFPALRAWLDRGAKEAQAPVQWLLLGSATAELEGLANQHLGPRIGKINLAPFQAPELYFHYAEQTSPLTSTAALAIAEEQSVQPTVDIYAIQQTLWLRGGYPMSYLAGSPAQSVEWRTAYLDSLFGAQPIAHAHIVRQELLGELWRQLSHRQGEPCRRDQLAGQLGCKAAELNELLKFLERSQLIRVVQPWSGNELKRLEQPGRIFIRDSGLLHTEWRFLEMGELLDDGSRIKGKSWEGFVLEALMRAAPSGTRPFFYKNANAQEIDIVLEFNPRRRWAIEIKVSDEAGVEPGFHRACEEVKPEVRFQINGGRESRIQRVEGGIEALCLAEAIEKLRARAS